MDSRQDMLNAMRERDRERAGEAATAGKWAVRGLLLAAGATIVLVLVVKAIGIFIENHS